VLFSVLLLVAILNIFQDLVSISVPVMGHLESCLRKSLRRLVTVATSLSTRICSR